jgi:hypothetical protein
MLHFWDWSMLKTINVMTEANGSQLTIFHDVLSVKEKRNLITVLYWYYHICNASSSLLTQLHSPYLYPSKSSGWNLHFRSKTFRLRLETNCCFHYQFIKPNTTATAMNAKNTRIVPFIAIDSKFAWALIIPVYPSLFFRYHIFNHHARPLLRSKKWRNVHKRRSSQLSW